MLLATVKMFLDCHSPLMNLFHQIYRHLPQPCQISKNVTDGPNRFLNRLVHINHIITLNLHPVYIGSILLSLFKILLRKQAQKFTRFDDIPFDLSQTSIPCLNSIINDMQKATTLQQKIILFLQDRLNNIQLQTLQLTQ